MLKNTLNLCLLMQNMHLWPEQFSDRNFGMVKSVERYTNEGHNFMALDQFPSKSSDARFFPVFL